MALLQRWTAALGLQMNVTTVMGNACPDTQMTTKYTEECTHE